MAKSNEELAQIRTDLSVFRTTMAASRSLMAWIRTGLSLNVFGYTIYTFLKDFTDKVQPNNARNLGLFLIGLGILSILFGCIEYWHSAKESRALYDYPMRKFPLALASCLGLLGLLLFLSVTLRII